MKKVIVSFLLIITLCTNVEYKVYADAGSIVVSGGAIAVGGLSGAALAGLTGPVVVAVFLGLMAFGMNVELTKQSQAAGMTKTEFVKNKIQEYCDEVGISIGVFNQYILEESQVLNDGRIKLSNTAASWIKKFGNWLYQNEQVENPNSNPSFEGSTVTIGNYTFPVNTSFEIIYPNNRHLILTFNNPVAICKKDANDLFFFNITQDTIGYWSTSGTVNLGYRTSVYYFGYTNSASSSKEVVGYENLNSFTYNEFVSFLSNQNDFTVDDNTGVSNDTFTGDRDDWAAGNPALDPAAGNSTVLNPGLTGGISIPQDKDIEISVPDYLDALEKALDRVGNPALDPAIDIPAIDDSTGLPTSISIPNDVPVDPTIDKVPDNTIDPTQKTPILDNNNPPTDPDLAMDPLKFDLKSVFPFCLPWDIKDMLNLLSADPVAPRYRVQWHIPIVNADFDFTVDLSPFNNVASICRKMELLAFIIGLAFVTRKLIRG